MKKILFLISILLFANFTAAQTCPRGEVNDPYPGQCGQYIDENQNNLCDQSEVNQSAVLNSESTEKSPISAENKKPDLPEKPRTEFVKIWVISWLAYLALELLAKKGKVSPMLAKKIFNAILLISFLVCAFSSLIYLIRADYGYNLAIPNLYQLHLQSGIWLIGISLAHLAWHWQYYWSYLRK